MAKDIAGQGEYRGRFSGMGHQLGGIGGCDRPQFGFASIQRRIDKYHALGLRNGLGQLGPKQRATERTHSGEIHFPESFRHPWPGTIIAAQRVAVPNHEQSAKTGR